MGPKTKASNRTARTEIKIRNMSDSLTGYVMNYNTSYNLTGNELNFDCFCLDIHLLLVIYKLLLIHYLAFHSRVMPENC